MLIVNNKFVKLGFIDLILNGRILYTRIFSTLIIYSTNHLQRNFLLVHII